MTNELDRLSPVTLAGLRTLVGLTQGELADEMGSVRTTVSRLERGEAAMRVDTLKGFIEALGGEMIVVARFPKWDNFKVDLTI